MISGLDNILNETLSVNVGVVTVPPQSGDGRYPDARTQTIEWSTSDDVMLSPNNSEVINNILANPNQDLKIEWGDYYGYAHLTGATLTAQTNTNATLSLQTQGVGKLMSIGDDIMKSCVAWYDPRRQAMTNADIKAKVKLKDLSGKGYDLTLYNFAGTVTSGIDETGALLLDGVDDYVAGDRARLTDFTLITDADCIKGSKEHSTCYYIVSADYPYSVPGRPFYFVYDEGGYSNARDAYYTHNFGAGFTTKDMANKEGVNVFTSESLNGHPIPRGTAVDDKEAKLCLGDLRQARKLYTKIRYRSVILFNRVLNDREIDWVR